MQRIVRMNQYQHWVSVILHHILLYYVISCYIMSYPVPVCVGFVLLSESFYNTQCTRENQTRIKYCNFTSISLYVLFNDVTQCLGFSLQFPEQCRHEIACPSILSKKKAYFSGIHPTVSSLSCLQDLPSKYNDLELLPLTLKFIGVLHLG